MIIIHNDCVCVSVCVCVRVRVRECVHVCVCPPPCHVAVPPHVLASASNSAAYSSWQWPMISYTELVTIIMVTISEC